MAGKADYGLDAPSLCRVFFVVGGVSAVASCAIIVIAKPDSLWSVLLVAALAVVAVYGVGMGCLMLYSSYRYKVSKAEELLDEIDWSGVERILDVGCGRGVLLVGALKRARSATGCGIDLWLDEDQASNSPEGLLRNADLEGVADRLEIATGNAAELPFEDASFDVVLTQWVLHNIEPLESRLLALRELDRVLKPGGQLLLADIDGTAEYRYRLRLLGWTHILQFGPGLPERVFRFVSFGSFCPVALFGRRPAFVMARAVGRSEVHPTG